MHFQDGVTPIEEILRGLDDLVSSGKILHAGLSNFPAWRVARAQTIADLRGWSPISGIQVEYSLVERTADRELLPMAEALGLGVDAVVAARRRTADRQVPPERRGAPDRLEPAGPHRGLRPEDRESWTRCWRSPTSSACPRAQVAMAWLRDRDARSTTSLISIIGPRNVAQLDDYLAALDVTLTREQYDRLDAVERARARRPPRRERQRARQGAGRRRQPLRPPAVPVA